LKNELGGTHAFRSNLFASKQAKRISTAIVAAVIKKLAIPFFNVTKKNATIIRCVINKNIFCYLKFNYLAILPPPAKYFDQ
jgi:hypothetical protein